MKKDFISISDYTREEIEDLLGLAARMKENGDVASGAMHGKTAALIFEKQSLRTRMSFEVGVLQLGGHPVFLSQDNIGLSTRESVRDIAEVLSRYNDMIVARTMRHATVVELAAHARIPVINALTDVSHPCQILADALTLSERGLLSERTKITFVGDGNNVVNSWLELAEKIPFHFVVVCPQGYEPDAEILRRARAAGVSRIDVTHDPRVGVVDADVVYTDVWVSMGQESEREARQMAFRGFQINEPLMDLARKGCVVMHCLPAHRGEEITAAVLDGQRSIVLEQAENRLHVQKAIMAHVLSVDSELNEQMVFQESYST